MHARTLTRTHAHTHLHMCTCMHSHTATQRKSKQENESCCYQTYLISHPCLLSYSGALKQCQQISSGAGLVAHRGLYHVPQIKVWTAEVLVPYMYKNVLTIFMLLSILLILIFLLTFNFALLKNWFSTVEPL